MKTIWTCSVMVAASACFVAPELVPAPGVRVDPDAPTTAVAELDGVRVRVDGAAWRSDPLDLAELMSPVKVGIENYSGRDVRVSYTDFALVGGSGFRYPAAVPWPAEVPVGRRDVAPGLTLVEHHPYHPPRPPRFHHDHFYVAPHIRSWYPGFFVWPHVFVYDSGAWARAGWPHGLPTEDMVAEALPEGVVQNGGRVDGFVYFQGVALREGHVRFQMQVIDAETSAALGSVSVPFAVRP